MPPAVTRLCLFALCTLAVAAPGGLAQTRSGTIESGWAESVEVERVFWPVRFESARNIDRGSDDCAGVTADDIRVFEDGQQVPVTHLDRSSVPTLHAILIDTSFSMRPRLAQAKRAARAYVRATVPDEPVLIASFDDSLLLRSPLTRDLQRLERAIDGLDLGNGTDLWNSVYHLVRFLEPLPGRKVIVLLSDGLDTHSVRSDAFETARWYAGTTPNLAIYPIGLQIPDERGYVAPISRGNLDVLGRVTGGQFLLAATPGELQETFRTIRELLDRELFVTYIPPPFGEGPRDRPEERPSRLRKVKVRVRMGTLCRLASGGPRERFVGRRSAAPDALATAGPLDAGAGAGVGATDGLAPASQVVTHPCLPLADPARVIRRTVLPERWIPTLPGEHPASLTLLDDPRFILGEVTDVVRESGQLYDATWLAATGAYAVGDLTPVSGARRTIAVEVPPLAESRTRLRDPLDVLLHVLRRAPCVDATGRSPLVVNGQTFQHLRRYVGQALFEGRGDYRAFAVGHLRREIEAESVELIDDLRRAGLPDEKRAAVLEALRGRARRPDPGQPQRLLADWLADVPIARLARRMESGAVARLLEGRVSEPGGALEIESLWPALLATFPPPVAERVRVPLVVAHDAARDRFGFYRLILPRFRPHRPPAGEVPPAPLAIRTARSLLDDAPHLAAPGSDVRLAGPVGYESLEGLALVRAGARLGIELETDAVDAPRSVHAIAVTIPLAATGGSAVVREVWARPVGPSRIAPAPMEPVCRTIDVTAPAGESAPLTALSRLSEAPNESPCP